MHQHGSTLHNTTNANSDRPSLAAARRMDEKVVSLNRGIPMKTPKSFI